ncbi:DUF6216 family protein [Aeromonas hydrophila]
MDSMISSIFNVESFISIATLLIIVALLMFYISNRAGSSFGIINKLINVLFSSKGFHSEKINYIWQEREDIERFNALFNTRAIDINQIISFDEWVKKYRLDLKAITRIGSFFEIKRKKIKRVPWYLISAFGAGTIFFFFVALFSFMLTVSNAALIKINKYEDVGWFWINSEQATSFKKPFEEGYKWKITKESCTEEPSYKNLPKEFVNELCYTFKDKQSLEFIAELISQQNKMLTPTIILVGVAIFLFSGTNKSISANTAREMIHRNIVTYRRNRKIS